MTRSDGSLSAPLPPTFQRAGTRAGLIGLVGVGACLAVWLLVVIFASRWPDGAAAFYRAWLFALLFWLGVSLGSMAAVMVHHLTGGQWGYFIRRFGEAAANVLPLTFVLFIPVLFGLRHIYPWADPQNHSAVVVQKRAYLNTGFFIGRYIAYFAIWIAIARLLRMFSLRRQRVGGAAGGLGAVSAAGLVIYVITMSFAAIDWIMSMDPQWYSTVFGFIVCMGQTIAGLSVLIIMLQLLSHHPPFAQRLESRHYNDLATLLVTAVILWAYNAFAQLLIIWIGNVQHEINWYVQRTNGPWRIMSMLLCFLGFLAPFVLLLQRGVKKRGRAMLWVCVGLLSMRLLDLYWMVAPGGIEPYPRIHWLNVLISVVALIGIGGLWIFGFLRLLNGPPLMPADAPFPMIHVNPSDTVVSQPRTPDHGAPPVTQPGIA